MRETRAIALVVLLVALALPARAGASVLTFSSGSASGAGSFQGDFTNGNDVALFYFDLTEDAIFQASTTSGGNGGFDPMLTLLSVDASNRLTWIADNDDSPLGGPDALIVDPLTDRPGRRLKAGRYALALTQTLNYFDPLRGGFAFDDDPFYACAFLGVEDGPCTGFVGPTGAASPHFDVRYDITPVSQPSPVPEPASLTLFGAGLAGIVVRCRRRKA